MTGSLVVSALLMGLAGTPHCVAMCGAACGGLLGMASPESAPPGGQGGAAVVTWMRPRAHAWASPLAFQLGRIAGYAAAGAGVSAVFGGLALLGSQVQALRPFWMLLQAAILGWGLVLMLAGRQPLWAARLGLAATRRLQPWAASPPRRLLLGAAWALMPCGLLYSALMLAALASNPAEGAGVMALFALGSAPGLLAAPWLWQRLRHRLDGLRCELGSRIAGALLAAVAAQALWMDLRMDIARWCA